jgi:beta-galactosidase
VLGLLADDLIDTLSIHRGPDVPQGIMARQIDERHVLYLNVTGEPKQIKMTHPSRSLLYDRDYDGNITIAPYEPEFVLLK